MDDPRLLARLQQGNRDEECRQEHLRVAAMLRGAQREDVVRYAKSEVQRWRSQSLCSKDYVDSWEKLLDEPLRAASLLEEQSPLARRLRQNTPFAAYLR